jgi:hypothetical protein
MVNFLVKYPVRTTQKTLFISVVKSVLLHTAKVAVPSEINTKLKNTVWEECTFLDAFAKLNKDFVSFLTSVYPSAWKNSAPIEQIFHETFEYFSKICRESH